MAIRSELKGCDVPCEAGLESCEFCGEEAECCYFRKLEGAEFGVFVCAECEHEPEPVVPLGSDALLPFSLVGVSA